MWRVSPQSSPLKKPSWSSENLTSGSSLSAAIKIIKKIKDATSLLDGTVSFEMSLSHDDIPVRWMFKGTELKPSDKCKILSERKAHKLVLQNVDSNNAGEYSAVIGHLQCSATLTVEG